MLKPTDKKYYSYHITQRFLAEIDRIVGNRQSGKVTYQEVCETVGMKSSNLKRLRESKDGENAVTIEAVGRLCHTYNVSPEWLILGLKTGTTEGFEDRLRKIEKDVQSLKGKLKAGQTN